MGEVMLRGNTLMKGYLRNESATAAAFRGGLVPHRRSRRLARRRVRRDQGPLEGRHHFRRREHQLAGSRGVPLSSSPDHGGRGRRPAGPKWGETPCAFITLKPDAAATTADDITAWCRDHLAHFKVPRSVVFGPLPKTSTGKIQKFLLREKAGRCERHRGDQRSGIARENRRMTLALRRAQADAWSRACAAATPLRVAASSVAGNCGSV